MDFLYVDYERRYNWLKSRNIKLAHYTSFDCALLILNNQSFWLRDAMEMKDRYELVYGKDLIAKFAVSIEKEIREISENTGLDFWNLLNFKNKPYWREALKDTYIASLIEHTEDDDSTGRVDMWERYAGENGVAFIMNTSFLNNDDYLRGITPLPVRYFNSNNLTVFLSEIISKIKVATHLPNARQFFQNEANELARQLLNLIISIKRPAFRAEQEWRLVVNQNLDQIGGHLKLGDNPKRVELNLSSTSPSKYNLDNLLSHIIVGPGDKQDDVVNQIEEHLSFLKLQKQIIKSDL